MSLKPAGPLDTYNSLTDEYLVDYFNNKRIRRHLRHMGLITRRGEVVDEPTFRFNIARKEHRTHVKDLMSQAVINKTLDLERNRRAFIRDKLIEIRKIETVNKVKRERDLFISTPPPPDRTRPKSMPQLPDRDAECVAGVTIPPGSVVKWVPLIVPPFGSTPYLALNGVPDHVKEAPPKRKPSRSKCGSSEGSEAAPKKGDTSKGSKCSSAKKARCVLVNNFTNDQGSTVKFESDVTLSTAAYSPPPNNHLYQTYSSPEIQPIVPGMKSLPPRPKSEMVRRKINTNQIKPPRPKSATLPHNQPSEQKQSFLLRRQVHSMSKMTLRYLGRSLELSSGMFGDAADVMIMQQHCGGNTVCVYQGLVSPNESFTFTSRRHRDAPFGITIYIGSMMDTRLSTCCEYRHKAGHILGGKSGHFALVGVEGCMPCYKCFAHINEFKKEENAAHNKFQEDVKKSKDRIVPKPPPQTSKKKKFHKKKKDRKDSVSSSENGDKPSAADEKVTVIPGADVEAKVAQVTENGVVDKNEDDHEIEEPGEEDIQLFKRLVINSPHPDDEEDEIVLQASDSEGELTPKHVCKKSHPIEPEELKLESESSSDEEKAKKPAAAKASKENGYDDDKFDSDDDNKSEASVTSSIKSEASIKSQSSAKSSSSIRSENSIKSNGSVKSNSSIKSFGSVKSNSSIKSNSTIKSDSTVKSDRSIKSNGSVRSNKSSSSTSTIKSDSSKKSDSSHSSKKSNSSSSSSSSKKSDKSVSSKGSNKSDSCKRNDKSADKPADKNLLAIGTPEPRAPSPEVASLSPEPELRAPSPGVEMRDGVVTKVNRSPSPQVTKSDDVVTKVNRSPSPQVTQADAGPTLQADGNTSSLSPVPRSPSPAIATQLKDPSELEEYNRSPSPIQIKAETVPGSPAAAAVKDQSDADSLLSVTVPVKVRDTETADETTDDKISMLSGFTESLPDVEELEKGSGLGSRIHNSNGISSSKSIHTSSPNNLTTPTHDPQNPPIQSSLSDVLPGSGLKFSKLYQSEKFMGLFKDFRCLSLVQSGHSVKDRKGSINIDNSDGNTVTKAAIAAANKLGTELQTPDPGNNSNNHPEVSVTNSLEVDISTSMVSTIPSPSVSIIEPQAPPKPPRSKISKSVTSVLSNYSMFSKYSSQDEAASTNTVAASGIIQSNCSIDSSFNEQSPTKGQRMQLESQKLIENYKSNSDMKDTFTENRLTEDFKIGSARSLSSTEPPPPNNDDNRIQTSKSISSLHRSNSVTNSSMSLNTSTADNPINKSTTDSSIDKSVTHSSIGKSTTISSMHNSTTQISTDRSTDLISVNKSTSHMPEDGSNAHKSGDATFQIGEFTPNLPINKSTVATSIHKSTADTPIDAVESTYQSNPPHNDIPIYHNSSNLSAVSQITDYEMDEFEVDNDENQLSPRNESDDESEISIHSNHDDQSETTTNAEAAPTPDDRVFSPTQSILSADSSKSKDPSRRIRFSETVTQRVASDDDDDEEGYGEDEFEVTEERTYPHPNNDI